MQIAVDIAIRNVDLGGGPFGAVIVRGGKVLASCGNRVLQDNDPTAHAEILAIREACSKTGNWELSDCTIYSSCEPCPMCLSAIYWAHIPVVYYGANQYDAEMAGFSDSLIYKEINKPVAEKIIKMVGLGREGALKAFERWQEIPGQKKY